MISFFGILLFIYTFFYFDQATVIGRPVFLNPELLIKKMTDNIFLSTNY